MSTTPLSNSFESVLFPDSSTASFPCHECGQPYDVSQVSLGAQGKSVVFVTPCCMKYIPDEELVVSPIFRRMWPHYMNKDDMHDLVKAMGGNLQLAS